MRIPALVLLLAAIANAGVAVGRDGTILRGEPISTRIKVKLPF